MHFKFVDLSDTLQMEHHDDEMVDSTKNVTDATDTTDFKTVNEIDSTFLSNDARTVKKISIPEKNVLEQLFISPESKTQTTQSHAETEKSSNHNHIPRIVEIDFKDKHFKTKGIKKSKMKPSNEN